MFKKYSQSVENTPFHLEDKPVPFSPIRFPMINDVSPKFTPMASPSYSTLPPAVLPQMLRGKKLFKETNIASQKYSPIREERNEQIAKENIDVNFDEESGSSDSVDQFKVHVKPSRRKNTRFAPMGVVPKQICSAPYKYLLKISHPTQDEYSEGDFSVYLTAFDAKHKLKGKLKGGIEFEYLRSTIENDNQVHFYHVQFTLTSFLNQNEKYKLNVVVNEKRILETPEFLLVARKNKKMDDYFWDDYTGNSKRRVTRKKKKKKKANDDDDYEDESSYVRRSKRNVTRKRSRYEQEDDNEIPLSKRVKRK